MMQQYTDKNLTCVDCGGTFLFSADDQEFYARKGFTNEPKRCKPCRDKRKASSGEGRERTFYDVTCDGCGKQTQVPFNPTNGKPVYCRECYSARRAQQAYKPVGIAYCWRHQIKLRRGTLGRGLVARKGPRVPIEHPLSGRKIPALVC